ncbi:MAG: ABC transporter ATP-binding protein [Chloroflexi bacterium]|nr:ABC transporter ATP-binding protein [Chloroflexota bacterium]
MIEAEGLGKRFDERWAVRDLSLEVHAGEVFGFLGPNGAGKTTTVRMLSGMIAPTSGRASLDGLDVLTQGDAVRARIGLLTESPGLYERMSAAANLDFHGRLQGLSGTHRRERVRACLELVGLWERRNDLVAGFSKGMKQKLAIARSVLHEPKVVFLDEPTSGLDPESTRNVREFIRDLREAGRTIFLCTHNLDEARRLCDRVAIFRRQILYAGTPRELEREALGRELGLRVVGPPEPWLPVVREMPFVRRATVQEAQLVVELRDADTDAPALVRGLVGAGADVQRIAELDSHLEEAYLSIVGERSPSRNGKEAVH